MNKPSIFGLVFSLLTLVGFTMFMVSGTDFPVWRWPYEAYQGLVFSVVWGLGVSPTIGYLFSAMVVVTIFVVSFAIGHKLARLIMKR